MTRALITGITGQDGSYLAEFLLAKHYEVHGIIRRSSTINTARLDGIYDNPALHLHYGDVTDGTFITTLLREISPDEVYHLAGQSHVRTSFEIPVHTAESVAISTLHLLEAIRFNNRYRHVPTRFYQASSSEMFGNSDGNTQNELTPFQPRSPYACAKTMAYWAAVNYREAYNIHASNGILFNHESPRRGETFVTRKITRGIAKIVAKKQKTISLGNLEARRDWGYAKDYIEAMWMMLQERTPDDYVIATGESHSVREFCEEAFSLVDLDWTKHVIVDPKYFRPTEVHELHGDPDKAERILGWKHKTSFKELVRIMVDSDLAIEGVLQ